MARGVLLDIAGVLYQGDQPLPSAAEAVSSLRNAGLPIRFLTNSTRRPKRAILDKLRGFGIDASSGEVMTPAAAACSWLEKNGYAPHLLIHPDLEEDFATCRRSGPCAVIVGDAGPYFTYERLNAAFHLIKDGAPFLALASNRIFRDADGELSMDAGAFARALEYSSGTKALLFGKPAPAFFHAAANSMKRDPAEVTMVGDDAENDIAGALKAGLGAAILLRTGKYQAGDEAQHQPRPSSTEDSILSAARQILDRTV